MSKIEIKSRGEETAENWNMLVTELEGYFESAMASLKSSPTANQARSQIMHIQNLIGRFEGMLESTLNENRVYRRRLNPPGTALFDEQVLESMGEIKDLYNGGN